MGMTAHPPDDASISAKEPAKGPEVGGWKGNSGEKIFAQIPLEFWSSNPDTSVRDRSKSTVNGLNPAGKSREWSDYYMVVLPV